MADIFVSYAKEDLARARGLAEALQSLGWSVWWDRRLRPGEDFAKVIAAAVRDARCLIVLWSEVSINSGWVRDEANEGLKRQVLVPLLIDAVEPPMGFRHIQTGDLVGWHGDRSAPGFQQLVADLVPLLGEPPKGWVAPQSRPAPTEPSPARPARDSGQAPGRGLAGAKRWITVGGIGAIVVGAGVWGGLAYKAEMDRRAAELAARQQQLEEAKRRADEEAAKQLADLKAKQKALEEQQRLADAEAARRFEEEKERRRVAAAETARKAEEDRKRAADEAARQRAEEARRQAMAAAAARAAEERKRAAEEAAREQATREQAAREQAARDQAAREQAAREQAAREQAARDQAAREQAARDQAAREQAAREQAAREQAARDQAAREQAARDRVAPSVPSMPADTCIQGYVWREAVPGDRVCVTPQTRAQAANDNAQAAARRQPGGGAYGPDTCRQGFVWREATPTDHVCVTPGTRDQARYDNSQAAARRVRR